MPYRRDERGRFDVSVCVRGVRLHRRLPPGATAGDAKRAESELRVAAGRAAGDRTRHVAIPGDPPLAALLAAYCEDARHLRSPDTARHHACRIGLWADRYRASQARQCAAHIVRDLRGQYADGTINRSLGTLKRALHVGWERGHCAQDWSPHVRLLPEHNARSVYLGVEQVAELTRHASASVRAAIWIALLTGCRRGEILDMYPRDVGADSILIHASHTKTLRTRSVPIVPALRPWLEQLPLPINAEGLKSGFRRAREAAGMPHVHFHDLRHSCASILLELGVDLYTVSHILGHGSIKTTERYAHLAVAPQRTALQRLGRKVQAIAPEAYTRPPRRPAGSG